MSWNPFSTLTGRLLLVTFAAVTIAALVGVAFYSSERGTELRRAALAGAAERIAYNVERLRETPVAERNALANHLREVFISYDVAPAPSIEGSAEGGVAARVAEVLRERLDNPELRVQTRITETRGWRRPPGDDEDATGAAGTRNDAGGNRATRERRRDTVQVTELRVSVRLDENAWLNARALLPGPTPTPLRALWWLAVLLIVVGFGAALVARQIGKPLAQLADAAQALGAGDTHVVAPVSGPADVRRASTAFNAMAERLGRQLLRQRQMLWALSHDLRTPITALRLRAELIEDEATRQRLLAPVQEMERLTEQALELARAGASEEARASVDLSEIVRTLCGELQDMGVNVRPEASAPVMVSIRPSEIARALRNLAENAAKYAGEGVMRVSRDESGDAVVEVADEGPGVPAELMSRLTEPFFRLDAARSATNGAGLGLAIAQAIADSHGGTLILENRTPRGFSARLVLPS